MRFIGLCCLLSVLAARLLAFDIGATTQQAPHGPDTVILDALVNLYQPVPFDHKTHAEMAEMWDGCVTCHHRPPSTQPVDANGANHRDQADSDRIPACKSCHEVSVVETDIHMPSLKGAYHRQCLNCHREWANENSCTACHTPRGVGAAITTPTRDDIIGRMHPPIPQPEVREYVPRFTPAVGSNVIFRHSEHSTKYGLKCVNCHRHDNCSNCHNGKSEGSHLMKAGRTWDETHATCTGCHQKDRCTTCHYNDGEQAPPPFEHQMIGQILDEDHAGLKCGQCHPVLKARKVVTCGDATCHKPELAIAYPRHRPGPVMAAPTTQPSTRPVVEIQTQPGGEIIKRVRRPQGGGL